MPQQEQKMLHNALNQIQEFIKGKNKDKNGDEAIEEVVECCDNIFAEMTVLYCPNLQVAKNAKANKSDFRQDIENEKEKLFPYIEIADSQEEAPFSKYLPAVEMIFPPFINPFYPLQKALDTSKGDVVSLLPYLLSAYYLSLYRSPLVDSVGKAIFQEAEDQFRDKNFGTNVKRFVSRFSCENRIQSYLDNKRMHEPAELRKLKSQAELVEYLRKTVSPMIYYSQFIKAFIYSACATACAEKFDQIDKIDFKKSQELFNQHTLAFEVPYVVEDISEDSEKECVSGFWPYEVIDKIMSLRMRRYYKKCEKWLKDEVARTWMVKKPDIDKLGEVAPTIQSLLNFLEQTDRSTNEQNLYIKCANFCFLIYNPLIHPYLNTPPKLIGRVARYNQKSKNYTIPYLCGPRY